MRQPPAPLVEPWAVAYAMQDEPSRTRGDWNLREGDVDHFGTLQLDAEGICDDYEWNKGLDSIGLTRKGMSLADIASRWRGRQDSEQLAAE